MIKFKVETSFEYVCNKHEGMQVHFNGLNCTCCPVCTSDKDQEELANKVLELEGEVRGIEDELYDERQAKKEAESESTDAGYTIASLSKELADLKEYVGRLEKKLEDESC